MDWILDSLAVSSFRKALLFPEAFDALLCVAEEKEFPETDRLCCKIPITDMQPMTADQLAEAVRWIREHIDDHQILVFCNAGIGRAPSVVVGYLCCEESYGFGEAVEHVASRHPEMSTLPGLVETIDEAKRQLDSEE